MTKHTQPTHPQSPRSPRHKQLNRVLSLSDIDCSSIHESDSATSLISLTAEGSIGSDPGTPSPKDSPTIDHLTDARSPLQQARKHFSFDRTSTPPPQDHAKPLAASLDFFFQHIDILATMKDSSDDEVYDQLSYLMPITLQLFHDFAEFAKPFSVDYPLGDTDALAAKYFIHAICHQHAPHIAARLNQQNNDELSMEMTYLTKLLHAIRTHLATPKSTPLSTATAIKISVIIDTMRTTQTTIQHHLDKQVEEQQQQLLTQWEQMIISMSIQCRGLENKPQLDDRHGHDQLSQLRQMALDSFSKMASEEQQHGLHSTLQQIEQAELSIEAMGKMTFFHACLHDPAFILKQNNADNVHQQAVALLQELMSPEPDYHILAHCIQQLRQNLHHLSTDKQDGDIDTLIQTPRFIQLLNEENDTVALQSFRALFEFCLSVCQPHITTEKQPEVRAEVDAILASVCSKRELLFALPRAIELLVTLINNIKDQENRAFLTERPNAFFQQLLIKMKAEIANEVKDHTFHFDQTQRWVNQQFSQAATLGLSDAQRFHPEHAPDHLVRAGLLHLLLQPTIDRDTLPDTLFLDYRRLTVIQQDFHHLTFLMTSSEFILSHLQQHGIVMSEAQRQALLTWMDSALRAPQPTSDHFTSALAIHLNTLIPSLEPSSLSALQQQLQHEREQPSRLQQIMQKRLLQQLDHAITHGHYDLAKLNLPAYLPLLRDFMQQHAPTLARIILIQRHLFGDRYQQFLPPLQHADLIGLITHPRILDREHVYPFIASQLNTVNQLQQQTHKILFIAAALSFIKQFCFHTCRPDTTEVTQDDIDQHMKMAGFRAMVQRHHYNDTDIKNHIREYRRLPLFTDPTFSFTELDHYTHASPLHEAITDDATSITRLAAILLLQIPTFFRNKGIAITPAQHLMLAQQIKSLLRDTAHPALNLFQHTLMRLLLNYTYAKQFKLTDASQWATLTSLREPILALAIATQTWIQQALVLAQQEDHTAIQPSMPLTMKSGIGM